MYILLNLKKEKRKKHNFYKYRLLNNTTMETEIGIRIYSQEMNGFFKDYAIEDFEEWELLEIQDTRKYELINVKRCKCGRLSDPEDMECGMCEKLRDEAREIEREEDDDERDD